MDNFNPDSNGHLSQSDSKIKEHLHNTKGQTYKVNQQVKLCNCQCAVVDIFPASTCEIFWFCTINNNKTTIGFRLG